MLISFTWKNILHRCRFQEFPGIHNVEDELLVHLGAKEPVRAPLGVLLSPGDHMLPPRPPKNLPPGTAGWGRPDPSGSPRWQCWAAASAAPAAAGDAFAPCPSECQRTSPQSVKSSPVVRHSGKWRGGYSLAHSAQDTQSARGLAFWTILQHRGWSGLVFKWFDGPSSSLNSTINRKFQILSLVSLGLWWSMKPSVLVLWLLHCLSFSLHGSSFHHPRASSETRDLIIVL